MTTAKKNIYFSPKKICNIYVTCVNWLISILHYKKISIRFVRNIAKNWDFFFCIFHSKSWKIPTFSFLTPYFPVFNKCKYCCSSSSFNDGGAAASGKGSTGSKCTFWILFHVILHYRVIYVTQTSTPKNYKEKHLGTIEARRAEVAERFTPYLKPDVPFFSEIASNLMSPFLEIFARI